jgi:acetyl-CoA carboxylase biotin carboxyl carrier protein
MPLSDDDIREILRLIDESEVEELRVETERFSLHVLRGGVVASSEVERLARPAPEAAAPPVPEPPVSKPDGLHTISAPMLGTFYRAEAPGAPPFVAVGTYVESHTVVCLIEVMKMMNSVPAGMAGTIVEVCAENAQLVEYGAPLFQVEPDR